MNAEIYRNDVEVLGPHAKLFRSEIGNKVLLMDENARIHHAAVVTDCLYGEGILRMQWPAYSSCLNPLEHGWGALGCHLASR